MPGNSCPGHHEDERFLPASPERSQHKPKTAWVTQRVAGEGAGREEQVLPQDKIFEDEILAGPGYTNNAAEEVPEPHDQAKNLIQRRRMISWPTH